MLAKEAAQGSRTWVLDARFAEVDSEHFKVLERGCAQSDGLEWPTEVRPKFVCASSSEKTLTNDEILALLTSGDDRVWRVKRHRTPASKVLRRT